MGLSRRSFLTAGGLLVVGAGATAAGVETGVLPGRSWAYSHLGIDGEDGTIPDVAPGRMVSGAFMSEARLGERCGWSIAYPPGERGNLPVVVVLHGRGNDHTSAFADLGLDRFLADAVRRGAEPFAIASVDGGETYWHARDNGEDAGSMVVDEFIPLLGGRGLETRRVGVLGWSMGGYGALLLASRLGPDRVFAVVAESPALWPRYEDTAPGAYDDEADFADAVVWGEQDRLSGIPVRIDCGESDPFYGYTRTYVDGFADDPAGGFQLGDHDVGYWRRMAPDQLRFLADSLASR
ncbi:alpha/beta hydrolase [Solicola gregarius]|uniref:Acyl-CoA:diacylglycerol acyltransferase n=1 Tax=Solicola gregarius TaxID=2908642 RepID=A0AA46TDY2_9ACTN|nr:alpha/beta hydrolase-fold protein [Solicola gregarius]UYM03564.1 alpha/beta hydrolase-fold protein [Solicola gregarius]